MAIATTTPTNPITELREHLHMRTRADLARTSGVAYSVLSAVEQGLAPRLPRSVLRLLRERSGLSEDEAERQYQEWRRALQD